MILIRRVGINFLFKVIYFPLILFVFPQLFSIGVVYSSRLHPLLLSLLFICIGLIADETILPLFGLVSSTVQGAIFMIMVIWLSQFIFVASIISIAGAIFLGLSLGIGEFFMHQKILSQ